MYAPHLSRVFSLCNRNLVLSRQLLSSHGQHVKVNANNFVASASHLHRIEFDLRYKWLTSVSFSTSSSPESPVNVPSEKAKKKRRRIISSGSSSDDNGAASSPNKSVDVK